MKKILILLVAIFGMNLAYGQTPSDTVYIIATPIVSNDVENGIYRDNSDRYKNDPLYKYPPIHLKLVSKSKKIWELFSHYNFNPVELAKTRPVEPLDEMTILIKPIEFLQTIKPLDFNIMFPTITSTRGTAEHFAKSLEGKVIFFIDRNEITPTTIKLIQMEYDTPDSY